MAGFFLELVVLQAVRESDAFIGEAVNYPRFVIGPAIAAQVSITQIVRKDEQNIRPGRKLLAE